MLNAILELISNNALYDMGARMAELKMYEWEVGSPSMTFAILPDSVVDTLHSTLPQSPAFTVTELNDEGNIASREEVRLMEAPEFKNRLLLYAETGETNSSIAPGSTCRQRSGTAESSSQQRKRPRGGEVSSETML